MFPAHREPTKAGYGYTEMPRRKQLKRLQALESTPTSSISDYLKKAWREDGSDPFDKAMVAAQAAARGEHTSTSMFARKSTLKPASSSSSFIHPSFSPPISPSSRSNLSSSSIQVLSVVHLLHLHGSVRLIKRSYSSGEPRHFYGRYFFRNQLSCL